MFLRQITDAALAQNAYLIGCQRTGEAIIVDPERDLDRYFNFIFVGDVGRPDLLESAAGQAGAMQPAARTLYASLRGTAEIPGHVQILPAHGAGSACGKSLGAVPVSVMTGFLGVGGGFLLVPALVKFARLPLPMATGTSLAIIACNSAAGFAGHLGGGTSTGNSPPPSPSSQPRVSSPAENSPASCHSACYAAVSRCSSCSLPCL